MFNQPLPRVAIIDYGMGNLFSIKQACGHAGLNAIVTSKEEELLSADAAILPGVGAFGDAVSSLKKLDLINPILDFVKNNKPIMGICLGMQLLFAESEEFGRHMGLNIIRGKVIRFTVKDDDSGRNKVPQVGWNRIRRPQAADEPNWSNTPLQGIRDGEFMYFVHSYYCELEDKKIALSITEYNNIRYASSILCKNIFACQFHPEKSASEGLRIYRNWTSIVRNYCKKG